MHDGQATRCHLAALERVGTDSQDVVVIGLHDKDPLVVTLAAALPRTRFQVLLPRGVEPEPHGSLPNVTTHRYLPLPEQATWVLESLRVRPRAIIDHASHRQGSSRPSVSRLLWALRPGDPYILRLPSAGASAADAVRAMLTSSPDGLDSEATLAIERIEDHGDLAIVHKASTHLLAAREWPRDDAPHTESADRIHSLSAYAYESRARLHVHGSPSVPGLPTTIEVPDRHLRLHHDATCFPRMLATAEGRVLPSSFRHPHNRKLTHPRLVSSAPEFVRHGRSYEALPELSGTFFQLDSTYPGHFGHAVTEQLSHLWAWDEVRSRFPDARVIVTLPSTQSVLPPFQLEMLAAFGIDADSVVTLRQSQSVRVESLLTCTPAFENPHYVDLQLTAIWDTLFQHLVRHTDGASPERIFITRPAGAKRAATGASAIERFFAREGFHLVRPERLTWGDQARIFSRAKVIAGYGGSGMFNMMFNPHARVIVIASDAYTARNEHLIAAARGNELHYFFGTSSVTPRPGKHDPAAFVADFDFDLRAHGKALKRAASG